MKQLSFFPSSSREHGGVLSVGRRRSRRHLSTSESLHLTLKSEFATGRRSLLLHKEIIHQVIHKIQKLFDVRVYRLAICRNHIHLLIRGKTRVDLQNSFRVLAGHIAQRILERTPYSGVENQLNTLQQQHHCVKNRRRFWQMLTYTRIISWGREFRSVSLYILRNKLEALHLIAYQPRKKCQHPSPD